MSRLLHGATAGASFASGILDNVLQVAAYGVSGKVIMEHVHHYPIEK